MAKLKKIVIISHMYPRHNRGNYGAFISEQVRALLGVDRSLELTVISPVQYAPSFLARFSSRWRQYRETEKKRQEGGVPVYFPRYLCAPKKLLRSLAAWSATIDIINDPAMSKALKEADVIVAHTALFDGWVAKNLASKYSKEFWAYVHGEDLFQNTYGARNYIRRHNTQKILTAAKGVITVSTFMQKSLEEAYNLSGKCHVNHNGVDLSKFKRGKFELPPQSIITASFLMPRKAHEYVLRALTKLRKESIVLPYEIAGPGPEKARLEMLVKDLGLTEQVHFSGEYNHQDFPKILRSHALFVMPSWDEAFGVVYVEAMAMGLPVIAANDAGATDIVTDGADGYLVPPRDAEAIAKILKRYNDLTATEKLKMSEAAIKKAQQFTWEKSAQNLLMIIGGDNG